MTENSAFAAQPPGDDTAPDQTSALLEAALTHVPFDGMNDRAVLAGARDLGLSPDLARVLFPRGGVDLAAAYHRRLDAELRDWLAEQDPTGLRFRDRVVRAIRHRLEAADREIVRAASAVMALPQNSGLAARLVWETADAVWSGLGDRSDDVNWYSKRATLSAVHGATVLYWLGDESEGQGDTWAFLDRRIDGVMQFEKLKANARKIPGVAAVTGLLTGWIKAPRPRDLPGRTEER